ncbi:histone deacetylase-family protein [Caballeronia choica]|jgi:acetoin utilization deacetylase AcuC-like enzyme|uniref:Histone deacetylase-family protein n=1 Tax=Caballeronia choica TaxID=326476 RepID=A0A158KYQ5_9BURK|nr:histone deacetylase family protein [Caballeronia choica]SAL86278.1 histone deacetylase-family protein [Caballeronia choica]
MLSAYISHPDCVKHEMGHMHPESPERIGAIHDMLLIKGLIDCMQTCQAPLATEQQLAQAHSIPYIHSIASMAPTEGYVRVDPDTMMNPYTYQAALRAAGAAVLATDLVIAGKASTAFCNVRPPGHHAEYAAAGGFCFFNNVAVGIRHALNVYGLARVALIDFDVHHGNGSEDIFHADERVLMCSTFEDNIYSFSGNQPRGKNMVNGWLRTLTAGTRRCRAREGADRGRLLIIAALGHANAHPF